MASQFFITGLPRSRTSWFASFMSSGDILCWHEALNKCRSKLEFHLRMTMPEYRLIGNSDSGLAITDFQERFPKAPTLIIHRDVDEVIEELFALGICGDSVVEYLKVLSKALNEVYGWHLSLEDVDKNIVAIYEYLTGQQPDKNRLELFLNMRIQPLQIQGDEESLKVWLE